MKRGINILLFFTKENRMAVLTIGSQGSQVKTLQRDLNTIMGTKLTVDGFYGVNTKSTVKQLQKTYGLVADGIAGPATLTFIEYKKHPYSKTTIKTVQTQLNQIMGTKLAVDGIAGPATTVAVRKFQMKYKLTVDGIPGAVTQTKLKTLVQPTVEKPQSTANKGIDVSVWQGAINWAQVRGAGVTDAFIRCSYTGLNSFTFGTDSRFETNIVEATKQGIRVGVYHFSQARTMVEAEKEANFVLKLVKKYKAKITLGIAFDYEFGERLNSTVAKQNGKAYNSQIVESFCSTVKKEGYQAVVYANTNMFTTYLDYERLKKQYPIWLAQYASAPSLAGASWWQYTSSGSVKGINSKVDMNKIYKNIAFTPTDNSTKPEPTPIPAPTQHYTGSLPTLDWKLSAKQAIDAALRWGKWIAGDNTFHYGEQGRSADKGKPGYSITHRAGCFFCHTNNNKVKLAKAAGLNANNWYKTYVCSSFVTAIWAHGARQASIEKLCNKGGALAIGKNGRSSSLDGRPSFKYMGKLSIEKLQRGDILVSTGHMMMVYDTVSDLKCKIIHATSYAGPYPSTNSSNSIIITTKAPTYNSVYRFTGSINRTTNLIYGEYSDRVKLLQQFLNWYFGNQNLAIDGIFYDGTLNAVKKFQTQEKIGIDGIVGPTTLKRMATIQK